MGVEDPYVHVCFVMLAAPKPIDGNVKSSPFCLHRSCASQDFTREWLQVWFNLDVMTDFSQECGRDVPDLIVSNDGKSSSRAREGMLNGEGRSTLAVERDVGGSPSIPQC